MKNSDKLEMSIIGHLLNDEFLDDSIISEDMFYYPEMASVLSVIKRVKQEGHPIETVFLELEPMQDVLSNCTTLGIVTANYNHYCEVLKKMYAARLIEKVSKELADTGYKTCMESIQKMHNVSSQVEYLISNDDMRVLDPTRIEFTYGNKKGYVPTGFSTIDECLNDLEPGRVTLVTGKRYQGKTTFVRQVIANSINTGNKTLWLMGENETEDELRRLYQIVIGDNKNAFVTVKDNKKYIKLPNEKYTVALKKWSSGKLRILHKSEAKLKNHNEMFSLLEKEIINNRYNLVVIDNLMSMLSATGSEKNEAQANFMQRCCDISKLYKTHIVLVVHPRKQSEKKALDDDDISGSSDLPNKADNVIWVRKATEEEKEENISGFITITKNKRWGSEVSVPTFFKQSTETLEEIQNGKVIANSYNIDKFLNTTIKYNNGEEQTFEKGEFDPF